MPKSEILEYGELALNYSSGVGKSFIAFKKADDKIAQIMEKAYNDSAYASKEDYESLTSDISEINESISGIDTSIEGIEDNIDEIIQTIDDNEFVIANALNRINTSAGFNESGVSTLPNGISLTEAIKNIQNDFDTHIED